MKKKTSSLARKKSSTPKVLKRTPVKENTARANTAKQRKSSLLTSLLKRRSEKSIEKTVGVESVQQEVSSAKFYTGYQFEPGRPMSSELPDRYHEDKIIIQVRDPWWIHAYWEIRPSTIESVKSSLNNEFEGAKAVLRVYDVSFITFNGRNAHRHFDIDINFEAKSWYIDTGGPGRGWCVEIGLRLRNGRFIALARSNSVMTPLDGPSWMTDEEWMVPDEVFTRLYGMGFGFGPASPTGKGMLERVKREKLRLLHISSPGLFSVSSPRKVFVKAKGQKGFWLVVNTELIVYGATEPDAKVTVCGKSIKLKKDGTFSLRFALPDGKQTIPVEARSSDGEDYRSVTPVVSKETH